MEGHQIEYQHRPLDATSKEIRLLRVVKTEPGTPIELELRHVKLSESEEFNALSYCWGEGGPDHEIHIRNGAESGIVFVRANLFHFLKLAHETAQDWSLDWMWIDQICVNQDKHDERCHQVGLMGELYTAAKTTLIWPGLLPAFPLKALTSEIEPLFDEPIFTADELAELRIPEASVTYPNGRLERTLQIAKTITGRILWGLCSDHYWRRLWIIQELVLASHDLILVGGHMWALNDLLDAIAIFLTNKSHTNLQLWSGWHTKMEILHVRLANFLYLRERLKHQRLEKESGAKLSMPIDWADVVGFGSGTDCSLHFDRVYGLMGLLPDESLRVDADYTITQDELLRRILTAQVSFSAQMPLSRVEDQRSVWSSLDSFMFHWNGGLEFEQVVPHGWIEPPLSYEDPEENLKAWLSRPLQHNIRLLLQKIGVPLPTQITDFYGVTCQCEYDSVDPTNEEDTASSNSNLDVWTKSKAT